MHTVRCEKSPLLVEQPHAPASADTRAVLQINTWDDHDLMDGCAPLPS